MLSHEDCLAADSRSTVPQQQNADNCNCLVDISDWQTTDVDNWRCWLFVCNCWTDRGSGTLVQPVMVLVRRFIAGGRWRQVYRCYSVQAWQTQGLCEAWIHCHVGCRPWLPQAGHRFVVDYSSYITVMIIMWLICYVYYTEWSVWSVCLSVCPCISGMVQSLFGIS